MPSKPHCSGSQGSEYDEHEVEMKPFRQKHERKPELIEGIPDEQKHLYIDVIAELTDSYKKSYKEIKFEPALLQSPLKFLEPVDIKAIIKVGLQKLKR